MAFFYKNFLQRILHTLPILLLFYFSLKDDNIFSIDFLNFFSFNFQYIIIYYWGLKNPRILGYGYIFLAGIVTDVMLGLPMGISSLSFLVIATLATYTRIVTVRISLLTDWFTFIPALLSANLIYSIVLYNYEIPIDYIRLLISFIFTLIIYPFAWVIFEMLRRLMRYQSNA